jgi:hypothetical protein
VRTRALWCRTRLPLGASGQRAGTCLGRRLGRALRWSAFGEGTCVGGGCAGPCAGAHGADRFCLRSLFFFGNICLLSATSQESYHSPSLRFDELKPREGNKSAINHAREGSKAMARKILVMYGSQTGNAQAIAEVRSRSLLSITHPTSTCSEFTRRHLRRISTVRML